MTTEDDLRTSPRDAPRRPAGSPCRACPYRRDAPSGVWEASEYAKLPAYDRPTQEQPMAVFLCHEQNGRVCAGWAGCHDTDELFALRFAAREMDPADLEATRDYASPVPLFASGAEAARHGLADVDNPGSAARKAAGRLAMKRDRRTYR